MQQLVANHFRFVVYEVTEKDLSVAEMKEGKKEEIGVKPYRIMRDTYINRMGPLT